MTYTSRFNPTVGGVYEHINGGTYLCIAKYYDNSVILKDIQTGRALTVFDVRKNNDGKIRWVHCYSDDI